MEPQITPNTFCSYTGSPDEADTTIFFISGNPGLIGYYHPFLSLLARYLADSAGQTGSYQIYGCSLGGFEISDDSQPRTSLSASSSSQQKTSAGETRLYDLENQIRFVQQKLVDLMNIRLSNPPEPSRKCNIVLVGHSVGAYIAMELVRRHREAADRTASADFDIVGGVMLFPTVVEIALSPSGQKLTVGSIYFYQILIESACSLPSSPIADPGHAYPDSIILNPTASPRPQLSRSGPDKPSSNKNSPLCDPLVHERSSSTRSRHDIYLSHKRRRRETSLVCSPFLLRGRVRC